MTLKQTSDQLLDELGESLPQGVPNATRFEDDFSELDDLLQDSVSAMEEKAAYQADLKARKKNYIGMDAAETAACVARMQAFEQARMWKPVENLAVFARYICTDCFTEKLVFTRYMQAQTSRTNPTARRWDTVAQPNKHLPTRTAVERRLVPTCPSCAVLAGLDTHTMVDLTEVLK